MSDYRMTLNEIFDTVRVHRRAFLDASSERRPSIEPAKPFANPSFDHASQVFTKLVRETEHELLILCGTLKGGCHSALRMTAQLKRQPAMSIRILVDGDESGPIFPDGRVDWAKLENSALIDLAVQAASSENTFIAMDGEAGPGRIAVRVLPTKSELHYTVSDRFALRIEHDLCNGAGSVNPMDPATASSLADDFDTLWRLSSPLKFPQLTSLAA
jgi:hypothetical protein